MEDLIDVIRPYIDNLNRDGNHRYSSWEHCYEAFARSKEQNVDYLSLHMAFYLASWGMYRGSSGLLWKDYRIHKKAVIALINHCEMRDGDIYQESFLNSVNEVYEELNTIYSMTYITSLGEEKIFKPTETLITKILLGSLACIPALDRNFRQGWGIATNELGKKKFFEIFDVARRNKKQITEGQIFISKKIGKYYPVMKIVDMYYWQKGLKNK